MVCCQGEAGTDKAFVQGKIPGNPGNPRLQLIDSEHVQLGVCTLWHFYDWIPIIHSRIFGPPMGIEKPTHKTRKCARRSVHNPCCLMFSWGILLPNIHITYIYICIYIHMYIYIYICNIYIYMYTYNMYVKNVSEQVCVFGYDPNPCTGNPDLNQPAMNGMTRRC